MRLSSFFQFIIALLLAYSYLLPVSAVVITKPILSFPPPSVLSPHDESHINVVAFSPDGKTMLSASDSPSNTIKLWDAKTKKLIYTFTGHTDTIHSLSFSPDGKTFLSSSDDKTVRLWNVQTGTKIRIFKDDEDTAVCTAKFSPDGNTFLSGHQQSTLRLRDINTGKDVITFAKHTTPSNYHSYDPCSLAFSPDGKTFLSGSADGTMKQWDTKTGHAIYLFSKEGYKKYENFFWFYYSRPSVAFSPNGKMIAIAYHHQLIIYDAINKQKLYDFTKNIPSLELISFVAFSPDNKFLVSRTSKPKEVVQLYNLEIGNPLYEFSADRWKGGSITNSISFSPDSQQLLTGVGDELALWDIEKKEKIYDSTYEHTVNDLTVSPDGQLIASAGGDNTLTLWEAKTGKLLHTFIGHTESIYTATFSPDGETLLSSGKDGTLRLWDITTKKLIFTAKDESIRYYQNKPYSVANTVYSVAFSPDGQFIVSGGTKRKIKIWNAKTGRFIRSFETQYSSISAVIFSPDGKTIVSKSYNGTLKLWDSETGKEIHTFKQYSALENRYEGSSSLIAVSPNGKVLASVGEYNSYDIILWDVKTGNKIGILSGHSGWVTTLAFSTNGMHLVSGSDDKTVKIWNTHSREELYSFTGHTDAVTSVAFLSDEKTIISGSRDRTLKQWLIPSLASPALSYASYNTTTNKIVLPAVLIEGKAYRTTFCLVEENKFHLCESEEIKVNADITPDTIQYNHTGEVENLVLSRLEWNDIKGSENYTVTLRLNHQLNGEIYAQIIDKKLIPCCDDSLSPVNIVTDPILSFPNKNEMNGHANYISAVAFSPDGKTAVSGSFDQTFKLWNVQTKQLIQTFEGHNGLINMIAFSPDGNTIASVSYEDLSIKLWNIETGKLIRTFKENGDINSSNLGQVTITTVTFSPDGKKLLSGGASHAVLWDIEKGEIEHIFYVHSDIVIVVKFSADGKKIITGSLDHMMYIYDLERVLSKPDSVEYGLDFYYQYANEDIDLNIDGLKHNPISADFLPDERYILITTEHNAKIVDTLMNSETHKYETIHQFEGDYFHSFALSKDGKTIFFNHGNTISQWDMESKEKIKTFDSSIHWMTSIALSPDEKNLFTGHINGTLTFWNVDTGKVSKEIEAHPSFSEFKLSPNAAFIASNSTHEKTLTLWNAQTGEKMTDTFGNSSTINSFEFSTDGNTLFTQMKQSYKEKNKVKLWDVKTQQEKLQLDYPSNHSLYLLPSNYLIASYDKKFELIDLSTQKIKQIFTNPTSSNKYFLLSPDKKLLLTQRFKGDKKALLLWDVETGTELHELLEYEGHWFIKGITFSPNSQMFAFSHFDNIIELWDINTKEQIATFVGHEGSITSISFSPDGKWLLSSSMDKTATLWDIATQKPVHTFAGHTEGVVGAYFSPDGKKVISGSYDHTMKWWTVPE